MNVKALSRRAARPTRRALAEVALAIGAGLVAIAVMIDAGPDALRVVAVFAALVAIALALPQRLWLRAITALLGAWWLAVLAVRFLPDAFNPQPIVSATVGGAAFYDSPYQGAQVAAVLSVTITCLIALATVVVPFIRGDRRHREAAEGARELPRSESEAPARRLGRSLLVTWIGAGILAFTLVPDLRAYLQGAYPPLPYGWDLSNLLAWQGFVEQGLTPMKDFFYPYGFQWLFTLRSFGPVFQWLEQIAALAIVVWSFHRLSGGRPWRVIGCVLAVILVATWGTTELWRYLPAVLLPVAYAALGPLRHQRLTVGHWVLAATCLLAGVVEADLLGLGLIGVALVVVGELVAGTQATGRARLVRAALLDALPFVVSVIVVLLLWVVTGSLAGNLRFFADLTAVSASSAPDEKIYGPSALLVLYPNAYSLNIAVPTLLAVAGLLWARWEPTKAPGVRAVLLAGAGVSLSLLLKNLVRPLGDLELLPVLVALAWAMVLIWSPGSFLRTAAGGVAVAALLCLGNERSSITQYLLDALNSPAHAVRSVGVALDRGARTRAAAAEFGAPRFTGWPDEVIAQYYIGTIPTRPLPPFAIIGDSQMTYVLLHQRPPFQVDLYDGGRIAEERVMLSDLRRRSPPYLIFRRDFAQDGFPYWIRAPLIFSWMIRNYVPVRQFPTVDLLRRRRASEPLPGRFWRWQLGAVEDLGYIPSLSAAAQAPSCTGGPGCVTYALLRGRAAPGSLVSADVRGRGHTYGVQFRVRSGVQTYAVRLDRMWFSPFVGPAPRVTTSTPGFTATTAGRRTGGALY